MQKRSDDWLEVFASNFRKQIKIDNLQCPDIDTALEAICSEFGITLVRRFDDEMPDEEASADCDTRTIYFRETLRHDLRKGDKRARFIFIEEVGHILLGHQGIRHRSSTSKIYEKANARVHIEELEARRFAAAVLAPMDKISEDWDALKISEFFQLSLVAAEIRKEESDRFYRHRAGRKRPLPSCAIDFLQAAKKRGYPVKTIVD